MQIHELNNFTGTLGAGAYLAIDDGNDTGKISSQGLLAATEARIDNIIAGPAPSAEEIVDARLGADGVTYPSLGDAIRDQFTDLKSAISDISEHNKNIIEGYLPNAIGAVNTTTVRFVSSAGTSFYFHCKQGQTYIFSTTSASYNRATVAFYADIPQVNADSTNFKSWGSPKKALAFTAPIDGVGVFYAANVVDSSMLNNSQVEKGAIYSAYEAPALVAVDKDARKESSENSESLSKLIDKNISFSISEESIHTADGSVWIGLSSDFRRTELVPLSPYTKIKGRVFGNNGISSVAFYDSNKNWLPDLNIVANGLYDVSIDLTNNAYADARYMCSAVSNWAASQNDIYLKLVPANDLLGSLEEIKTEAHESYAYLFDKNCSINKLGYAINRFTGELFGGQGDNYCASDYVDITGYKAVSVKLYGNSVVANIAFYDEDYTCLTDLMVTHGVAFEETIYLDGAAYEDVKYVVAASTNWESVSETSYFKLISKTGAENEAITKIINPRGYKKILTIGDSLTNAAGGGSSGGKRWQNAIVQSFGLDGFTTEGASGLTVANVGEGSIYSSVMEMTEIDDVNLVTFWGGTNDFVYNGGVQIGTFSEQINPSTRDATTFYGALIACVEKMLEVYPTARIILVGTTPRVFNATTGADQNTVQNSIGLYLSDYVEAVEVVANYYAIPFINMLKVSGINKHNISNYMFLQTSGNESYYLHFSDGGEEQIGNVMTAFIRSIG